MSQGKFAAMTSALLVRKGGAAPSFLGMQAPEASARMAPTPRDIESALRAPRAIAVPVAAGEATKPPIGMQPDAPLSAKPPLPKDTRRVVLMLSREDYERLGIAAVKKNITRHQFAQAALFAHLEATAREHGACHCIASGGPCGCVPPPRV